MGWLSGNNDNRTQQEKQHDKAGHAKRETSARQRDAKTQRNDAGKRGGR